MHCPKCGLESATATQKRVRLIRFLCFNRAGKLILWNKYNQSDIDEYALTLKPVTVTVNLKMTHVLWSDGSYSVMEWKSRADLENWLFGLIDKGHAPKVVNI